MSQLPVFVINLESAHERRAAIDAHLRCLKINYTRWAATPGDDLDSSKFDICEQEEGVYISSYREWSKNEAACGVSHIRVLRHIVSGNIPWAVVLEDDARLSDSHSLILEQLNPPSDADLILLNERSVCSNVTITRGLISYGPLTGGAGTDGYLVSLEGARKLLQVLYPLKDPLDFQIYAHCWSVQKSDTAPFNWNLPLNPLAKEVFLTAYKAVPALIYQARLESTIGGQRHPRARFYCNVLLGSDFDLMENYSHLLSGTKRHASIPTTADRFEVRAVDITHFDDSIQYRYRKSDCPDDPMKILSISGVNCVRISIWFDQNSKCNLSRALRLARQATKEGLRIYLALHYSDFWADPTHQRKPADWSSLTGRELHVAVHEYTQNILMAFDSQGTSPFIVQIGNEITNGFLWEESGRPHVEGGKILPGKGQDAYLSWRLFAELISHAIRAVRETSFQTGCAYKVMLHIDQGANPIIAQWWFNRALAAGIDFDVIGLSFYYLWHNASLDDLDKLSPLAQAFPDKEIMICETSYPYRLAPGITAEPPPDAPSFSPEGQAEYISGILRAMRKLPNGSGASYWGAFFLNNHIDPCSELFRAQALFDENGCSLPALSAFSK